MWPLLATLKCGAAFVPLDPSFPADRLPSSPRTRAWACCDDDRVRPRLRASLAACWPWMTRPAWRGSRPPAEPRPPTDASPTSSTPRARRAGPRASRSTMRASSTSSRLHADLRRHRERSRLPGHDAGLRLLHRGNLADLRRRGDAGGRADRPSPARRRADRLPDRAANHRPLLRADAAGHARARRADAAHPAGRRRGVPGGPRQALEPAGPAMLNTYGPTETTVTATWTELCPASR